MDTKRRETDTKKEVILSDLKDLIKTLISSNVKDEKIKKLWDKKAKKVQKDFDELNSCDMLWIDEEYHKWYRSDILPILNDTEKSRFKKNIFPIK